MGTKRIDYYGVLNEIIELQYLEGKRVVMFKCDWWDVHSIGKGVKIDKYGFVSVNTTRKLVTDEPFVLASQAAQVFYVKDGFNTNWQVVLQGHPENYYDLPSMDMSNSNKLHVHDEAFQQKGSESFYGFQINVEDDDDLIDWERNDIDAFTAPFNAEDDNIVEKEIDFETETKDEDLLL